MFGTRMELGRIAGITIYLDMMFVLVLLIFTYPYFTAGSTQAMSAGFVIIVGLLLVVLMFAVIWITQLRRVVEQRTAQLQRETRERERVEPFARRTSHPATAVRSF